MLLIFKKGNINIKNRISPTPFGCRAKNSTIHLISNLADYIVHGLDEKLPSSAIMCDRTKAFDCVNINILLSKLVYYGTRGKEFQLFPTYLTYRKRYAGSK